MAYTTTDYTATNYRINEDMAQNVVSLVHNKFDGKGTVNKNGRIRDNQRARLYTAESDAAKYMSNLEYGIGYHPDRLIELVELILNCSPMFEVTRMKEVIIGIYTHSGKKISCCAWGGPTWKTGRINIDPQWSNLLIVCHELAHLAVPTYRAAPHGKEFAAIYVNIVHDMLGEKTALRLLSQFLSSWSKVAVDLDILYPELISAYDAQK